MPAVQIDSSLDRRQSAACHEMDLAQGLIRLLFVSPERLALRRFLRSAAAQRRPHLRHRRGPLHQPLGPRFSPRISPDGQAQGDLPRRQRPCLHRHGDRAGPPRHLQAAQPRRPAGAGRQLRSAQSHLPRPAAAPISTPRSTKCSNATRARRASSIACAARTWTTSARSCKPRASSAGPITPA